MLPFESHGGRLISFNDGHTPETFRFQASDESSSSKIVTYDSALPSRSEVHVYDDILHPHHARMLYDATTETTVGRERSKAECSAHHEHDGVSLKGESPWGTYVTIEEALNWIEWKQTRDCIDTPEDMDECCISSSYEVYKSKWMCNIINFCKWQQVKQSTVDSKERNQSVDIQSNSADCKVNVSLDMDSTRHALAREAVAQFFLQTIPVRPGSLSVTLAPDPPPRHESLYQLNNFLEKAHGVAVWALSSHPGQSVQYHIDYAELLRYEYNVTVPPLFAGTIQCSELWNDGAGVDTPNVRNFIDECDGIHECCGHCRRARPMLDTTNTLGLGCHQHRPLRCSFDGIHECGSICAKPQLVTNPHSTNQNNIMRGGEFCVNLRGLEHYTKHGYKGNLSGDAFGGWRRPIDRHDSQFNNVFRDESTQWVTIPYAFNRGICHKGDLPHLSAPIEKIGVNGMDAANLQSDNTSPSRVIVGFNVFGHDVGEVIAKAPEHSRAFRRKVKLFRAMVGACASDTQSNIDTKASNNGKKNSGLNLAQVSQNKALTKLLVLAKREKFKQEFKQQQDDLTNRIWCKLFESKNQNDHPRLSVNDVIEEFGNVTIDAEGRIPWPKPDDVRVHLHRMIEERKLICDVYGTAGAPGVCYAIVAINNQESETVSDKKGWVSLSTVLDVEMMRK